MRYTHIGLKDQARAVGAIPMPKVAKANPKNPAAKSTKKGALRMRCIPGVAAGRSLTSTGNEPAVSKRQNPCVSKGFGVDCHQPAVDDLVGATGFEPATSWTPCKRTCYGNEQ
jgi:hypothetical protein